MEAIYLSDIDGVWGKRDREIRSLPCIGKLSERDRDEYKNRGELTSDGQPQGWSWKRIVRRNE